LVSSLEAYNYLKKEQIPLNIAHFPLSLSDIYKLTKEIRFEKKYDLLVAGRENPVLDAYLSTYVSKYPDFEYIFRKMEGGKFIYHSNKTGAIGEFGTREEFLKLLRTSKCAFYSTPGIDGDEARTCGFSPVTPRFFEFIAVKCFIIARYPDNDETRFFECNSITPNIESYEKFEKTLNGYLASKDIPDSYIPYLDKQYTSERITLLKKILETQTV